MAEENRLTDIRTVRELLSRHGFHFSKAMGQNFLVNLTVSAHGGGLRRIAGNRRSGDRPRHRGADQGAYGARAGRVVAVGAG